MATIRSRQPATQEAKHVSPYGLDDNSIGQYNVFVNKSNKHIMVLQFPNRDGKQPYNALSGQKPLRLRIKPKCGLVEVDVSLVVERHYDRVKGARYEEAMTKSRVLQHSGSYGLAGGLGIDRAVRPTRDEVQALQSEASNKSKAERVSGAGNEEPVMNKITLGGKIIKPRRGKPNHYLGVFKNKTVHLTRISAFCSLTPQFHHLDAITDNERVSHRIQREAENPTPESEARAVNMAVKSNDNEEIDMGQVARELRLIDEEPWQQLEWIDEDDSHAFETYGQQLVLDKQFHETRIVSRMTKHQYLNALSAPRVDPTKQGKKVMIYRPQANDDSSDEATGAENSLNKKNAGNAQLGRPQRAAANHRADAIKK
ncbi:hypothetical protein MMC13_006315 [Lambiella insularis]|nr:hypothetical protein [Lambiella insularis]